MEKIMSLSERHQKILELLKVNGIVSVNSLSRQLNVSSVTIRKDLGLLEEKKLLYRSHGGAIQIDPYIANRHVQEKEKLTEGINQAQVRKRMVEKSIEEFLEVEKNLEQYLDDRSFNQKLIDELVDKIFVSSKGMIEVRMKCSDVFQKVMEIME